MDGETFRVESFSRGWRRFSAGFIAVLIAFAVLVFVVDGVHWATRGLAVLLLIGQVPLAFGRFSYAEVTSEGLGLDVRVRRRCIPWSEVQEIELRGSSSQPPRVVLTDGSDVRSIALGGFVGGSEADPALLVRLERAAETHGFSLSTR